MAYGIIDKNEQPKSHPEETSSKPNPVSRSFYKTLSLHCLCVKRHITVSKDKFWFDGNSIDTSKYNA
jgi:hypothetical protein